MNTETLDQVMFNMCKDSSANVVEQEIARLTTDEINELSRFTAMVNGLIMDREISYNPVKEI
jgi:hypothetical protein